MFALAYLALFGWPLVAAFLFARLPRGEALLWTLIGGYLLLPMQPIIDLPALPTIDKSLVPAVAALIFCLSRDDRRAPGGDETPGWLPQNPLLKMLTLVMLFSPVVTSLVNGDPLRFGPRHLPGLTLYDAGSVLYSQVVMIAPFLLARRYLRTEADAALTLRVLALAGLGYSLLALIEIRFSPQLNLWIYGFRQFSFAQQMREGGFRPVVFLEHGLWTAMVACLAVLAATGLWRLSAGGARAKWLAAAGWMMLVLMLSRSLGAFALALIFAPLLRFAPPRAMIMGCAAIGVAVLSYPMLRNADLVPVDAIVDLASKINEERGESLQYRIDNEDMLLRRAGERSLLGWGGWSRSRVFHDVTGRDLSVTDGRWVIVFGKSGWIGYIAEFGVLTLPLIAGFWRARQMSRSLATLALLTLLTVNLIDLMPNASLMPITWLVLGVLVARSENGFAMSQTAQAPTPGPRFAVAVGMIDPDAAASETASAQSRGRQT